MSSHSTRAVAAIAAVVVGLVAALVGVTWAAPASAQGGLSVSKTSGLDSAGETITVFGSGFDETKGVYVAFCVDNGPGVKPSPCMGGADPSGSGGSSHWISSNPPSYAVGLTTPFGPGGSFTVTLTPTATDATLGTDCRITTCSVVVRYDHTRPEDRSGDVRVPISFREDAPPPSTPAPAPPPAPPAPAPPASAAPPAASTSPAPVAPSSAAPPVPDDASTSPSPSASSSESSSSPRASSTTSERFEVSPAASRSDSGGIPAWSVALALLLVATLGGSAWYALRRRA